MSAVPGKLPALKLPPSVETPHDQLVELLGRLLTIEETLAKLVLPELALKVQDEELGGAVRHHLGETRTHVTRIEQAFAALDAAPSGKPAIRLADAMGASEIGKLLRASLKEEVTALKTLAVHADRLARLAVEQPTAH
jgi:ferritin-like metal-binding protein YciE